MTTATLEPVAVSDIDLRRVETEGGVEFVDGRLVGKPVSVESSRVAMRIGSFLLVQAMKSGEAEVFESSMGYKCFAADPSKFRKPDVSLVRTERLAGVDPQDGFLFIAPDLAVEVVSPNDLAYDLDLKVQEYLSNGFPLVWVVYPNTRSVAVHRADGSTAVFRGRDEITGEAALPGFKCPVSDLFGVAG
jgi:Uma2 family endonuclease